MWQLSECIDGMAEACRALGIPVVGGNVSLYNESRGRDIDPTPVVGMLGLVERMVRRPPGVGLVENGRLLLLGRPDATELAGSSWADARGHRGGTMASLDYEAHATLAELLAVIVGEGLVEGVHDVSEGGLAVALAEMAVRSGVGFRVTGIGGHAGLFSEAPSRAVICARPEQAADVVRRAADAGVAATLLGGSGGDRLVLEGLVDVGLDVATRRWRDAIPAALS